MTTRLKSSLIGNSPAVILAALVALAHGQDASPAYDAASIRVSVSGGTNRGVKEDKAQVVFTSVPLKRLIQWAYKVYPFQVSGPDWLEAVAFDISAKYPPNMRDDDRPAMLRTLLEDRLKLAVHRETRKMPGYALMIAKGGFKLRAVEPGPPVNSVLGAISPRLDLRGGLRRSVLIAKQASIPSLADLVSRIWDQIVIDKTGLAGVYDFELRWNNDDLNTAPPDADSFPDLFSALQERVGLRLQAEKVPLEIIVVDHVERVPTEN